MLLLSLLARPCFSPDATGGAAPAVGTASVDMDRYRAVSKEAKRLRTVLDSLVADGTLSMNTHGEYSKAPQANDWENKYKDLEQRTQAEILLAGQGITHPEDRAFILSQYQSSGKTKDGFDAWFKGVQESVKNGTASNLMRGLLGTQASTPDKTGDQPGGDGKQNQTPDKTGKPDPKVNEGVQPQDKNGKPKFTADQIANMDLDTFKANKDQILGQVKNNSFV